MFEKYCPRCGCVRFPMLEIYQRQYVTYLVCNNCSFNEEILRVPDEDYLNEVNNHNYVVL